MATTTEKTDLESGSIDVHLYNDTIDTISWDKVSVMVENKKLRKDKYLIDSVDGAASSHPSIPILRQVTDPR